MKLACWSCSGLEQGDQLGHRCLLIAIKGPARQDGFMEHPLPQAYRWIKTECGRAKNTELAARPGPLAKLRLACFVLIAAIQDWRLTT